MVVGPIAAPPRSGSQRQESRSGTGVMMQSTSVRPSVASFGNVAGLRPRSLQSPARQPQRVPVRAAAGAAGRVGGGSPTGPQGTGLDFVPDRQKRTLMNLLLVGALGLPGTALLGPFVYFFVPKRYRTTLPWRI